jgi:hypothetical protein
MSPVATLRGAWTALHPQWTTVRNRGDIVPYMDRRDLPRLGGTRQVGVGLARVITRLVLRQPLPEAPREARAYRRKTAWRRLGRALLAVALMAVATILILIAVWQPGLPHLLADYHQSSLSSAASIPSELRPSMLSAAGVIFGLFVNLVAPKPYGEGPAGLGETT